MTDAAVLTDIRSMIDLAIGTPEVGTVDFCMLHTVLHCLAQQLQVLDKPVELHGDAAGTAAAPGNDQGHTVAIKEYIIETDRADKPEITDQTPMTLKPQRTSSEPPSLIVVERVKKDKSKTTGLDRSAAPKARDGGGQEGRKQKDRGRTVSDEEGSRKDDVEGESSRGSTPAPRQMSSTEKLSLVTMSKFNLLEDAVKDIKDRVYGSMPKNEQILEEVRSQTNIKSITDMWTNLNVSSRLEAVETGLAKLSSLVEDLIREGGQAGPRGETGISPAPLPQAPAPAPTSQAPSAPVSPPQTPAPDHAPPASAPGAQGTEQARSQDYSGQYSAADLLAQLGPPYPWDTMAAEMYEERVQLAEQLQRLHSDLGQLKKSFYTAMENMEKGLDPKEAASKIIAALPPSPPLPQPVQISPPTPAPLPAPLKHAAAEDRRPAPARRTSASTANLMDRIAQLEKRIKECCDEMGKGKGIAHDQLNNFQDQLDHLMHQISTLRNDFAALNVSPDLAKDLEGVSQLYQSVQDMQDQLRQLNEVVCRLAGEKDDRQHHMNALLEQIEILKTIKLDREDMAEAMAEKADLRLLARKVSLDQFEMACDDLSRGLDHALGKLNTQESLWQQVLDDIQREIESKLDKMELSPLKEFFNNKLRQLQENLKQMASLRRDVEAAGTTRRLLRDVNCVSCTAEAVMSMDNTSTAPSKPLPGHLSMKPYLSYELDAIRKTQASNLPQRNLHDWETIDKQMAPKTPIKAKSETEKHMCNRYCGGSHTTTTPAQRVARLGHFVKQWGPDVVPLTSHLAAGDDGRLYKVSGEQPNVGPGGTAEPPCTKKPKSPETPKPAPPKPAALAPECRCLEEGN